MKTATVANKPKAGALKLLLVGFVVGSGLVGGFLFADVLGLVLGGVLSLFVANLLLPGNANPEQEKAKQEQFERWCKDQNQSMKEPSERFKRWYRKTALDYSGTHPLSLFKND